MNINGYTKQLADTENKLYYMHFYLNVNDSHIHGMFIQTRFNKTKSHIYIMFQCYIYNYVNFRLTLYHSYGSYLGILRFLVTKIIDVFCEITLNKVRILKYIPKER